MSITAVASLAQSAVSTGPGTRAALPGWGLAFRFKVTIDDGGIADLGSWQSCGGLKVNFKSVEQKAGGAYSTTRWLAGEVSWAPIVLKRAAVAADSTKVQQWLQKHGYGWLDGQNTASSKATIHLYDSAGTAVLTWHLNGVRPASWSCADLDATSSKLAIETLELVHEGFTVTAGATTPTPSESAQSTPLTLGPSARDTVAFTHPPTTIHVEKVQPAGAGQLSAKGDSARGQGSPAAISLDDNTPNVTTYRLNDLVLEGEDVRPQLDKLTQWATKSRLKPGGDKTLPLLELSWGSGFAGVKVMLRRLTASYVRFTSAGVPTRAKVSLTLEQAPLWTRAAKKIGPAPLPRMALRGSTPEAAAGMLNPKAGMLNPTSGGIPGRASHLVHESDSLAAISRDTYGSAKQWRAVADANGIDDPLRVRPGTALLLPAPSEVGP